MLLEKYKIKLKTQVYGILIFLCAAVLLLSDLSGRTFWMDETAVLEYLKYNPIQFLIEYSKVPDNHPPLYYLLVTIASSVLPWSEIVIRLVSVVAALGIVVVVYVFARTIWPEKKYAYLSAFFTAFSSYFVLIGQMARYHTLAALFSLASIYYFYLLTHGKWSRSNIIRYILVSVGLCITDYPHFIYIFGVTSIYLCYHVLKKRLQHSIWSWIKIQSVILVSFIPMLWLLLHRMLLQGDGGFEKHNVLANSVSHVVLTIAFHVYVFFFGENIFPWNLAVFLPGLMFLIYILGITIRSAKKKALLPSHLFIFGMCVALIGINTIFLNVFNPRYNFIVYPKYVFAAYPLFVMALIGSVRYIKSKKIEKLCLALWFLVASIGLYNFYSKKNYINASYFNTFESFEFVRESGEDGDRVVINGDLNEGTYVFYQEKYFQKISTIRRDDLGIVPTHGRVWFFSTSSDDSNANQESESKIPEGFRIIERFDSAPLDPKLKKYKEKILGYESYTYKYSVFLLEKI